MSAWASDTLKCTFLPKDLSSLEASTVAHQRGTHPRTTTEGNTLRELNGGPITTPATEAGMSMLRRSQPTSCIRNRIPSRSPALELASCQSLAGARPSSQAASGSPGGPRPSLAPAGNPSTSTSHMRSIRYSSSSILLLLNKPTPTRQIECSLRPWFPVRSRLLEAMGSYLELLEHLEAHLLPGPETLRSQRGDQGLGVA